MKYFRDLCFLPVEYMRMLAAKRRAKVAKRKADIAECRYLAALMEMTT